MKLFAISGSILAYTLSGVLASDSVKESDGMPQPIAISVPSSLSESAQKALQFYNLVRQSTGNKMFDGLPEANDLEGWKQRFEDNEKGLVSFNEKVVERFEPTIQATMICDVPVLDIKPKGWEKSNKIAVYVHGGGFTMSSAEVQKFGAVPLADMSGLRVISVDYKHAPFASHKEILNQVVSVFKGLKDMGISLKDVVAYGDSSGANLVAAATLKMRDEQIGVPAAVIFWSGWMDLTLSGDTCSTLEAQDPILSIDSLRKCALAYAPQQEHTNPLVSPLFGDFTKGFPPTLIQVGTKEMLASDSIRLFTKLKAARQDVEFDMQEGVWHAIPVFTWELPEGTEALKITTAFIRKHLM
jgi:acetyl esterase/lipase